MDDNTTITPINGSEEIIEEGAARRKSEDDEKVECLIKEIIRIRPQDFQAFKHALEAFVKEWD